jgi:hypothetical protein
MPTENKSPQMNASTAVIWQKTIKEVIPEGIQNTVTKVLITLIFLMPIFALSLALAIKMFIWILTELPYALTLPAVGLFLVVFLLLILGIMSKQYVQG